MVESKGLRKTVFTKIGEFRPGESGLTVEVKVVNSKLMMHKGRPDGTQRQMRFAECLVGYETVMIVFTARNDQLELMKKAQESSYTMLKSICTKVLCDWLLTNGAVESGRSSSMWVEETYLVLYETDMGRLQYVSLPVVIEFEANGMTGYCYELLLELGTQS